MNARTCTAIAIALLVASPTTSASQRSPFWGNLRPGNHAVGYDIIEVVDSTRIVRRPRVDGIDDPRSRFRHTAIHVWYPAVTAANRAPMTYRQYILQQRSGVRSPDSLQQSAALSEDWVFTRASYRALARADWESWQDKQFEAQFGAPWAPGRFPAIIGFLRPVSTAITAEFLASHGFVVAMVRPIGRAISRSEQALSIEDQERAMPIIRRLAGVSSRPFGAMGFSGAGFAPLLLSMKSGDIGAFASIESGYFAPGLFETLTQSPYYDVTRLTVPFLYLYSDALAAGDRHFDEFSRMRYSTRYHFLLHNPAHNHWDYATEGMAIATLSPARHPTPALVRRGFEIANEHLLAFFRSTLLGDSAAHRGLLQSATRSDSIYSLRIFPAAPEPIDAELLLDLFRRDAARAHSYLETVMMRDSAASILRPEALNRLGYDLLRLDLQRPALSVFEMVTRRAPSSANAFDSYAEALETARDTASAIRAAERALALAPSDSTLNSAARDNLIQINRERLARLKR